MGDVGGFEVVQAYGTLRNSSAPRVPKKQLLAFAKVWVPARGKAQATLMVVPAAHAVLREPDLVNVVEPGAIEVRVGGSSDPRFPGSSGAGVSGVILIAGPAVELEKC